MIVTDIRTYHQLGDVNDKIVQLLDYVAANIQNGFPLGRIELDGDNLFINSVELDGVAKEKQVLEMHRQYIDVHILLSEEETIGWKHIDDIRTISQEYCSESDCALSTDVPDKFTILSKGDIAIAYPEDGHAPAINNGSIRKLIGKIRL